MMNFVGRAKRLDDIDLPRIAARIGVGEDELHAILDVETRGSGFDPQGRPIILFEPHVFHRNLTGAKRDMAVRMGLAYPHWGEKPYGPESEQYPRLIRALAIDETAALKAASWGLGQILGENHKAAGYATPQAMVADFCADEENQLNAVVSFIIANGLADEVRRHDWAGLAKGYNGAGYAKNGYHTKLSAAFRKWQRIPDTPLVAVEKRPPQQNPTPAAKPQQPPASQPAPQKAGFFARLHGWLSRA